MLQQGGMANGRKPHTFKTQPGQGTAANRKPKPRTAHRVLFASSAGSDVLAASPSGRPFEADTPVLFPAFLVRTVRDGGFLGIVGFVVFDVGFNIFWEDAWFDVSKCRSDLLCILAWQRRSVRCSNPPKPSRSMPETAQPTWSGSSGAFHAENKKAHNLIHASLLAECSVPRSCPLSLCAPRGPLFHAFVESRNRCETFHIDLETIDII